MRKLVYLVATSLDGFIAAKDGDISSFPSSGEHIEALLQTLPETLPGPYLAWRGVSGAPQRFDSVVMGYRTYELGLRAGVTNPYPQLAQFVCSRRHSSTEPAVCMTARSPRELVRELKARPGKDIWLCGGGELANALSEEIDGLVLKVNPILLGDGIRLFEGAAPVRANFTLVSSRSFASGVLMNEYARVR